MDTKKDLPAEKSKVYIHIHTYTYKYISGKLGTIVSGFSLEAENCSFFERLCVIYILPLIFFVIAY